MASSSDWLRFCEHIPNTTYVNIVNEDVDIVLRMLGLMYAMYGFTRAHMTYVGARKKDDGSTDGTGGARCYGAAVERCREEILRALRRTVYLLELRKKSTHSSCAVFAYGDDKSFYAVTASECIKDVRYRFDLRMSKLAESLCVTPFDTYNVAFSIQECTEHAVVTRNVEFNARVKCSNERFTYVYLFLSQCAQRHTQECGIFGSSGA